MTLAKPGTVLPPAKSVPCDVSQNPGPYSLSFSKKAPGLCQSGETETFQAWYSFYTNTRRSGITATVAGRVRVSPNYAIQLSSILNIMEG